MVPEVYQLFWAAMARGSSSPTPLSKLAPIASRASVVEKEVGVVGTPTLIVVPDRPVRARPRAGYELTAATGHPAVRDGISWPKALAND
jgi:hypothetical protein